MAQNFKTLAADLTKSAKAADSPDQAMSAIISGIINEIRVHREDGPALEQLADTLEASAGDLAAAVSAKA